MENINKQNKIKDEDHQVELFIVIGSSRGLGAALVDRLLDKNFKVIGMSRTPPSKIPNYDQWIQTGNFEYYELDIASPDSSHTLEKICNKLPSLPIGIIYNAAVMKTEINKEEPLDLDVFFEVNRVQIDGFGRVLWAFEKHLLKHGGLFAAISSFSAYAPAILDPRIAYPASKAYLDMAMRCLNAHWKGQVRGTTIHLGHLGEKEKSFLVLIKASYQNVAQEIIKKLTRSNPPVEINYPFIYCLAYKYFLRFVPHSAYVFIFNMFSRLLDFKKTDFKIF